MHGHRSMENIEGWRSQFDRVRRWEDRTLKASAQGTQDELDFYLAFFLNCYSLRDWIVNAGVVKSSEIDRCIKGSVDMRLCRDICNRTKHLLPDRKASADALFSIAREYRGRDTPISLVVLATGAKTDLRMLMHGCMKFWTDFVQIYAR